VSVLQQKVRPDNIYSRKRPLQVMQVMQQHLKPLFVKFSLHDLQNRGHARSCKSFR